MNRIDNAFFHIHNLKIKIRAFEQRKNKIANTHKFKKHET